MDVTCRSRLHKGGSVLTRCTGVILATAFLAMPAAALEQVEDFGSNPGALDMFLHLPQGDTTGLPLVVAMHGCTQSAGGFDDETGLAGLAESAGFVLLLPQQRTENNEIDCFNWFEPEDNEPNIGESASIAAMIDHAVATLGVDESRIFVLGLSAGGAMTAVMMANYPERFAAGAIVAGLPYGCNHPYGLSSGLWYWFNVVFGEAAAATYSCGLRGYAASDRGAEEWANFVLDALGRTPASWPRVSIWHGDADETVDVANLRELVEQWTALHGIDATPDSQTTDAESGTIRETYVDGSGTVLVETHLLPGYPHAFPINPNGTPPCGTDEAFITDAKICAARQVIDFFGIGP